MLGIKCLHGNKTLGDIKIANVMGGLRGLPLLMCDTSYVDALNGIFYRGIMLKDVVKKLPRSEGGKEGTPEGAFWLLTLGNMPTKDQAQSITCEWNERGKLPDYVTKLLDSMDKKIHPMAQFIAAIACLNPESQFVKAYNKGAKKPKYWEYIYEDSMNLCAYLISVAAIIYGNVFKEGKGERKLDGNLDWSGNFCKMLGFDDKNFFDLMRLYLVLHADHEGGNVSAHTTHLVGSALSDPYLSFSAAMCGLAGPLHGLANQEVLVWLTDLKKTIGEDPKDDEIIKFVNDTLASGRVVPGYGHAVLRDTDPRFVLQNEFAMKNCKDDVNVKLVTRLWKLIPDILKKLGKVSNPYPNVDAHSGVLLQHYCLRESQFYTVLFGVSRALGVLAQLIWARALGAPLERPKSFTTSFLCQYINEQEKKNEKK
ncbi:probable citrate synthase, mitochondrial isoform X2 [Scaptodrosophila lebanonensis]|nr:probable citrate synthase, mitochondrial isoform X2 [Scaptodrosophila lebanonensis]XP_030372828.1 probable citrate synthase, mitochondrial isoform X2 [Scaptodrosophila lebanonensis]XP_030372830.1 probable citrate synthase, mitochondrial isoform X2 [Scaptodrosophila lebanonensis]